MENKCYCCELDIIELWDICEICGWQNCPSQNEDPDHIGGANKLSLNDYKKLYLKNRDKPYTKPYDVI